MRSLYGTCLATVWMVALVATSFAADAQPISVRVRQTPGAAPLFAPILAEGDEVWATYRDLPEKPALVARKHSDGPGYDIFLGPGQIFRELFHAAAKTAGVHCYLDCRAGNVIAAEGYVAVQNVTDKPLTVTLRDGTRRTLDIPKGATRILTEK